MRTFVVGDVHGRRRQLQAILNLLPRDVATDTLVLLGDLIDRGEDTPGVVADVIELISASPEGSVVVLRGNHEQMLLDFLDNESDFWLTHVTGCEPTFEQYTETSLLTETEDPLPLEVARNLLNKRIPAAHVDLFRRMHMYYEDEFALYVHAGLDKEGRHPRDIAPERLLWSRSPEFFKSYIGKPCVFGHTPTLLLPLIGRLGHHGIYMSRSAIGLDTSGPPGAPLSCLSLPDFTLFQSFPAGNVVIRHITAFLPEPLRAMKRAAAQRGDKSPATTD
ncbi:MAG: metallophosphoesterase [Pyrinomonadaceae bacterium]